RPYRGPHAGLGASCPRRWSSPGTAVNAAHAGDLELVRLVLRQDADAEERFSHRLACIGRMLSARNRSLGARLDADELEDVAQDVLTRMWAKLPEYAGIAAIESWLFVFCEGELRNAARRKARRAARTVPANEAEVAGIVAPAAPDP